MTPTIQLRDAGKRYVKYDDAPMLVTRALRFRARTKRSHIWGLRHVDLEVGAGESLGVIGRNGSGKSTMLRLLAGVTAPSEGSVTVRGRVAPLLSVGVGFHQELTGRENVYVNGTILGVSRPELDRRFDEIIDFAEIDRFVDTPVKFYSSGMLVRLGFAVAVLAEPDVLLVDEVLAVGDLSFQMKCYDRMFALRDAGVTIVVVSHNLNAIRGLCPRSLVVHQGDVRLDGSTDDAISLYHELLGEERELDGRRFGAAGPVERAASIESFQLLGPDGRPTAHLNTDDQAVFRVAVRFNETVDDPIFGFSLVTESGMAVYSDSTPWRGSGRFAAGERVELDVVVPVTLGTGSYIAQVGLRSPDDRILAPSPKGVLFYVSGRRRVHGVADLHATFDVRRAEPADGLVATPLEAAQQ